MMLYSVGIPQCTGCSSSQAQNDSNNSIHVAAAQYILGLKEKLKITQAAIIAIMEGCTSLI